jgi:hypothetical protein
VTSRGLPGRRAGLLSTLASLPALPTDPATMRLDFSHTGGKVIDLHAGLRRTQ